MRIGVVGLGLMGCRHASVLARRSGVELIGGADSQEAARRRFAADFGVPVYTDIVDLLEQRPDAVVIAVPDNAHLAPAVAALTAGYATLLEKPMATDAGQARQIADLARAHGAPLMIGQTLRFDPRYRHAHDLVHSGQIGAAVHCYARRNSAVGSAARYGDTTTLPWHVSVHDIDAVTWVTGQRIRDVTGRATDRSLGRHGHLDALGALLTLADGTPFLLESSWVLPERLGSGIDSRIEIIGTEGAVEVHGLDEGLRVMGADGVSYPDVLRWQADGGSGPGGAIAQELDHFLDVVRGNAPSEIDIEEALHVVDVVEALGTAVRTGTTVEVGSGDLRESP